MPVIGLRSEAGGLIIFGVCYYPEHWPRSLWASDARSMAALGLRFVRVGEFAWSRLEPGPGEFDFEWLDEAIDTLADEGLEIVMCTPTATPPKWLVDRWPDVLPVDPATGRVRGFGSRRHYDFSSARYRSEALRISEAVAQRYGRHPAVVGWQTDNELCCHETTLSASDASRQAFREWCAARYGTIDALNQKWGNVFWSMEYASFAELDLPFGAVTETNPAHQLAFRRFSSDQVISFHKDIVGVIRRHAPNAFITHNFIPMSDTGVDDYALANPLDFASFDNYPLGRTDLLFASSPTEDFQRYMRTGHPDLSSFYFDQTRRLVNEGFWVMEQQPGPVNWAHNNPQPADGMIRLWTLEAFAHGARCVSFFRWRQAPFAQEQMHAGLLRPDNSEARAWDEVERVIKETTQLALDEAADHTAAVALVTDVTGQWVSQIERQGDAYDFDQVQFDYYCALRELGVDVDVVSVDTDLSPYSLIVIPGLPIMSDSFMQRIRATEAIIVFGPRSCAKTDEFSIPSTLPPGPLQSLIGLRVLSVETLRADCTEAFVWNEESYSSRAWREEIDGGTAQTLAHYGDGRPAVLQEGRIIYIATLTDTIFLRRFLREQCRAAGVATHALAHGVRLQTRGELTFAFNYSEDKKPLPIPDDAEVLLGQRHILPRDVTVWRDQAGAKSV